MSDETNQQIRRASEVQAKYADQLMSKPHVVGVGVGYTRHGGAPTSQIGVVVMVDKKLPETELAPTDVIPRVLDGVPIDVQETGAFSAQ